MNRRARQQRRTVSCATSGWNVVTSITSFQRFTLRIRRSVCRGVPFLWPGIPRRTGWSVYGYTHALPAARCPVLRIERL